jgi:hypothetical protein
MVMLIVRLYIDSSLNRRQHSGLGSPTPSTRVGLALAHGQTSNYRRSSASTHLFISDGICAPHNDHRISHMHDIQSGASRVLYGCTGCGSTATRTKAVALRVALGGRAWPVCHALRIREHGMSRFEHHLLAPAPARAPPPQLIDDTRAPRVGESRRSLRCDTAAGAARCCKATV